MIKDLKTLAADTLTRGMIDDCVRRYAENHADAKSMTYDIGGVERYSYRKYFEKYSTVNFEEREKPSVLANAENLPFKANSVKNIICLALLEHVEDPDAVAREVYRVMKPGGRALFWVPFYWREHNYPIDRMRFTRFGICSMLERHGFHVKDADSDRYSGFFFVASHGIRFMMKDPHKCKIYDPLLYLHAISCKMACLDGLFNLRHPSLYTGTEVVVEK